MKFFANPMKSWIKSIQLSYTKGGRLENTVLEVHIIIIP